MRVRELIVFTNNDMKDATSKLSMTLEKRSSNYVSEMFLILKEAHWFCFWAVSNPNDHQPQYHLKWN